MYLSQLEENGMKRLKRHPTLWICCSLLLLAFTMVGHSHAQCNMVSEQLDAVMASCGADDLDCFVSLAKNNLSCAPNIAWYYMIMYAPDNPDAVLSSFLNQLPYSDSLSESLTASIGAAHRANQNQQNAGSTTSANEYSYGQ